MKVTIELVRKLGSDPYYCVTSEKNDVEVFCFRDNAPAGDPWNEFIALKSARQCAINLRDKETEIRTLIETL